MLVVMFLLFGAFFIISENNLALSHDGNLDKFISEYVDWIDRLGGNAGSVSGYLIKMDWLPGKS